MKKSLFFSLALIGFLASALSLPAEVRVQEIALKIPTYLIGPDDPNPPLWDLRVYPYPLQTDITRKKSLQTHRVVEMENDYIKVLILPDIGGRILAALDKTNNNFDFIYYNQVIKPGLVALRGAWLSGGIEWNFPTLGHTVNTYSPVNYKIMKNADGSATCVVGTEEWVRRMKWEVFITIYPDRSYFKTRIRLSNRTLTHNNGYFWANAATHAFDDTRVIFPPTDYTYGGGRSSPVPWPVFNGKDVSWYKNTESAHDFFCGVPGDYNGAYNFEKENGTVHYAFRHESPGKKFWTWGTAPSGAIWEGLLTDANGQYIEVQAGRLLTQGDTWIFEPHLVEQWEEWWYPVKNMHGFVKANPDAALNLEVKDRGLFIALNTTAVFEDAEVKVLCGEKPIFREKLSISPAGSYRRDILLEANCGDYEIRVADKTGKEIISYGTQKTAIPAPELQPSFPAGEGGSAEEILLQGYYALKHWNLESALELFSQAWEKEPGLIPAGRWLGILYYKTGKTAEALGLLERVLKRDEDDYTARYYRALAKIRLGRDERTEEDLYQVSRRAAYKHVAPYVLAGLENRKENYAAAAELLRACLKHNPDDTKARAMLAASLRHLGSTEEAEKLLIAALNDDPLDPLALVEKKMLSGTSELGLLRSDPQYYLEAATDYLEMGLRGDARRTLEIYLEQEKAVSYPIVYYYLGSICQDLGEKEKAREHFTKAAACSPDYVFPFRTETEDVLKAALEANPSDWKALYYLGNLLTSELRWEEGLECFERAARLSPAVAPLYRNLGEIYARKFRDRAKAQTMYEKAVAFSPEDFRLYVALDELYAINKNSASREILYKKAPLRVKENFSYILRRALYFVDTDQPRRALDILESNTFLPWEGWTGGREVYVFAHLENAYALIEKKKYREALKSLEAAQEYPENLGTGRPPHPVFAREDFLSGLCYQRMGEKQRAESLFQKAAQVSGEVLSEISYYRALAAKNLGKVEEARALLEKINEESERENSRNPSARAYLLAGLASGALGDEQKAAAYFARAEELDPSSRWAPLLRRESKIITGRQ
jgi:tetratricopeptide (TPR) repeat protein